MTDEAGWWRRALRPRFGGVAYAEWEWLLMRLAFVAFVLWPATRFALPYQGQPQPQGLAVFFDTTWIASEAFAPWLRGIFVAALGLYVVGWLPLLATAVLLAIHTLIGTLENSQGGTHHTTQIIGFVLLGQLLGHCHGKWRALRAGDGPWRNAPARIPLYFSQQLVAAYYVVAGLTKLIRSRGGWLADVEYLPLQIEKGLSKAYHDTLQPAAANAVPWMVRLMDDWPLAAKSMLATGWFLELFAFLALWNRATLALYGIGLILMHETISSAMGLGFGYNKVVLAIFFVNVPFWIVAAWRARTKRPPAA